MLIKKKFIFLICRILSSYWIWERRFFFKNINETIRLDIRLCYLNFLILPGIFLSCFQKKFESKKDFLIIPFIFMLIMLLFLSQNIFFFFFFYEISVIPIIIILIFGGSRVKREEAGFFLYGYAMVSATSMFWRLIWISKQTILDSFCFFLLNFSSSKMNVRLRNVTTFLCILTFMVKFPVFFIHVWLPKAHVEAPVYGSIILARILLKMRGSAFLILLPIIYPIDNYLFVFLVFFSFWGGRIVGMICFNQKDSKVLIALSRVQHMSLSVLGILIINSLSIISSFMILIGHGFLSPILFFIRRNSYEKRRSRSFFLFNSKNMKSLLKVVFWTFLVFSRMGLPPFILFEGEVLLMTFSFKNKSLLICFLFYFMFSGVYSISLLSHFISKKEVGKSTLRRKEGRTFNEMVCYLLRIFPLFLFYLNPFFIFNF